MMGTYQIFCLILLKSKTRFKSLLMPPRFSSLYTRMNAAMSGQTNENELRERFIGGGKGLARAPSTQNGRARAKTNMKNFRGDLFNDVLVFMTYRLLDGFTRL